ncbi:MAG: di-heme oxidoredictase family protein [Polyangiales bacterium]
MPCLVMVSGCSSPSDPVAAPHGDAGADAAAAVGGKGSAVAGRSSQGPAGAMSQQPTAAAGRGSPPVATAGTGALPPDTDSCSAAPVDVLFEASEVQPIVERRADGVIVTRGAGRVRGRHELEETYGPFGALYFENRSYHFTIEDSVAAGGSTISFTYEPEAPVSAHGPVTNFRHWKIYGNGNVFHTNVSMQTDTPQHQTYTVERNGREGRPMRVGDVLEFEFGIFISGNTAQDPDPIEGRTAYYTDTFRYRVGAGGLTPDNADSSGDPGPTRDDHLAGDTTIGWLYAEPELYFSQMALNIQPDHVQAFLRGRRLFHTDFETGAHSEPGNPVFSEQAGKLGPAFDAHACVACHERDGRGRTPQPGAALESLAVKLYAPATLGNQLQQQEGRAMLERYELRQVALDDGSMLELRKPVFGFRDVDGASLAPSIRIARQIPGAGLLEAIDEATILAREDAADCDRDGISGRAQRVMDPTDPARMLLGRFGWKAEKVSVAHQVADALDADMGVTSPLIRPAGQATSELSQTELDELTTYTRLLALPARRDRDASQVQAGETLFASLGCIGCHVPDAQTGDRHPFVELREQTIHPYTDLLMHDMGPDLADGSGTEQASEWRTPPLWGLGMIATVSGELALLHDGRARTPIEAVLWHGGEAAFARAGVMSLDSTQRAALQAFLESL